MMFDDPAFLLIHSKRHWVDRVLRSSTPEGLFSFLSPFGWKLGSTEHDVEARVMAETDRNYTVIGDAAIIEDSLGIMMGRAFTFRTYGENPYLAFIYDTPRLSRS